MSTRSLRIACVIHSLNGGGAERVIARLSGLLAERCHEVHLITLDDGQNDRHDVAKTVHRHCLGVSDVENPPGDQAAVPRSGVINKIRSIRHRLRRFKHEILAIDPDVVLSFCDSTNVDTLLALRGTGIAVVAAERSDPRHQRLGRWRQWMRRRLYRKAAGVVAQTETVADYLARYIGRDIDVIASAIDPPPPQVADSADFDSADFNAAKTIVGIGRYSPEKGFDRLIDAFSILAEKYPDWTLRIVGDGPQRPLLRDQIARLGLAGRVELTAWQTPIWPIYQQASIFVLASEYEGFPSVLLEAMASGVACVAIEDLGGVREIVTDGHDGLWCGRSVDSMAETIQRLIDDQTLRRQIAEHAPSVCQRFSWTAATDAFERLLIDAARRPD